MTTPGLKVARTFMEVFPIGLVVTLLSATILRKNVRDPGELAEQECL
jgi:hypothetical protein